MQSSNKLTKLVNIAIAALAINAFFACNSSSSDYQAPELSASTMVTSFSLTKDTKVLPNLDSIYFTIDLQRSHIFNADSLPYGTKIDKLIPIITTASGASVAEITYKRANNTDSVVNYLTNSTDTIDFSNGTVRLRIVAPDGAQTQTYTIDVLVHRQKPDSMVWSQVQRTSLPSIFAVPNKQCTAEAAGKIHCLTQADTRYCMSVCTNPSDNNWQSREITMPFTPDIASMRGVGDALYILDTDGGLHKSTDNGNSWSDTAVKMHYLYGEYNGSLLGSRNDGEGWSIVTYPSGETKPMPEGFAVEGTSLPIEYTFEMSASPQLIITGGRTSTGTLVADTWGYDGTTWARLSQQPLPFGVEGIAVAPYFSFKVNRLYQATKNSALFAFGGRKADGTLNDKVYVSLDFGMNWTVAGQLLQMPSYMPAMMSSQAFVFSDTLTPSRNDIAWQSFACPAVPASWSVLPYCEVPGSRIDKPVSEWECPYIYLFGGTNAEGVLYNTVWRGVINRFTFTPIP